MVFDILIEYIHKLGETAHKWTSDIRRQTNLQILNVYPLEMKTIIPEHLPENLEKFFAQAVYNLETKNFDASAMMSRKVLEVAVKTLDKDGKGNLYARIETLFKQNLITKDIKDWAHIIRDDGNIATHEESPVSPQFSEELLMFTQIFLMYTFSMPNMVKAKRKDISLEKEV